jgi:hypothetical protein
MQSSYRLKGTNWLIIWVQTILANSTNILSEKYHGILDDVNVGNFFCTSKQFDYQFEK